MSHQDVAAVWSTLHYRVDIDNILQELIGRYALDVSEHVSNRALFRAKAFSHIVALRTIFDLQRTYLQSPDLSFESSASLLSPDTLFSVIKHLLDVKDLAFCAHDDLPDHIAYCSFIGQTLVSGIRALHLRHRRLSLSEYDAIIHKFEQAWSNETLPDVDHFSINLFCRRMLAELSINDYDHQLSTPTCGIARLQDFYHGLYPLDDSSTTFEHAAQTATDTLKSSSDWFYCALVLYDISWAAIGAMIQMCMDNQYYEDRNYSGLGRDATCLTLTPRFKMLDQLFRYSIPRPPLGKLEWAYEQTQIMLCMSIRADCFGRECVCLGDLSRFVQELWGQHISKEASRNIVRHFEKISPLDIEPMLKELQSTLEARHAILPDVGKEFTVMSQKIAEYTNEWCRGTSKDLSHDNRTNSTPDDVFIVNCPELHAMPSEVLLPGLIGNSSMRPRQASLSSEDIQLLKNIPLRTNCGQCSYKLDGSNTISSARKVEPLSKTAAYLQDKLKERRKLLRLKTNPNTKETNTKQSSPQSARALQARRHEFSVSPRSNRSQEHSFHELPGIVHTLQPITENNFPPIGLNPGGQLHNSSMSTVDMRGVGRRSPPKSSSPATTYIGSVSAHSHYSDVLSRQTSRTFSPPPFPTPEQTTQLPEVVQPHKAKLPGPASTRSPSDASSSIFQSPSSRKWPFKSRRGTKGASSIPSAAFFTSGKALLLWNDRGACFYNLHNMTSTSHHPITTGEVLLAAGGTLKSGIICRSGPITLLRICQSANEPPVFEIKLEEVPFAMALSRNDHYLALKFGTYVRIFDTTSSAYIDHKLPSLNSRSGPKDHLVSFSTDSLSFAAATRFEPEKVVTYFCECRNPSSGGIVESSAPYGLVGDDGLSSIVVSPDKAAFVTTFTEKGYPAYLALYGDQSYSRVIRDKNQQIGSRIHSAALSATGQDLVLLNDRNEVFWIKTPFGKEHAPTRVGNIKREKSVKRDVELAMPSSDEVHVFWIYKGKGVLVTMGRQGGKSKPIEFDIDLDRLLESV